MVGQVWRSALTILFCFFVYLQPVLLSVAIIPLFPGRDTQDDLSSTLLSFDDSTNIAFRFLPFLLPCWIGFLQASAISIRFFKQQAMNYWFSTLLYSTILLRIALPSELRHFTRKHGRWRHSKFFPATFLLLSSVSLNHFHLTTALQWSPGRALRRVSTIAFIRNNSKGIHKSDWIPTSHELFTRAVDPQCPKDHFFYPEFFNLLPFEEYDPYEEVRPSLLHLSVIGHEWMTQTLHEASVKFAPICDGVDTSPTENDSTPDDFMETDILRFHQKDTHEAMNRPEYERLINHLSSSMTNGQVILTPRHDVFAASLCDFVDTKLIITPNRAATMHADVTLIDRIFPVLIDTGCSVATSGFLQDFGDSYVEGNFGTITTANGKADVKGFGMAKWSTVTECGLRITVTVPCYHVPEIQMRLFLPQDYAGYHQLPVTAPTMFGAASWFAFETKNQCSHQECYKMIIRAPMESQTRLFFFHAETPATPVTPPTSGTTSLPPPSPSSSICSCDQANVSRNVMDPRNHNLSRPQKRLLLDHFRFGHVHESCSILVFLSHGRRALLC